MSTTLSNGKVIVGDETITVKGLFGQSGVIQKERITKIRKEGGMLTGIWFCITVIGLLKGIRILMGNTQVHITTGKKENVFWMKTKDYNELLTLI